MLEKMLDAYLEKPLPETLAAHDTLMAALSAGGAKIEDGVISDFALALERAAFRAGFADAVALMQELTAIRQARGA